MNPTIPALETPRLLLRGATLSDVDDLRRLWSQPAVRRYLFDDRLVDGATARSILEANLAHSREGHGLWLVARSGQRETIGCIGLAPAAVIAEYEPAFKGLLEPVVALAPDDWGKGYASESLHAVLAYAFGLLRQAAVAAANDIPNAVSERMLLRAGFSPFGEVRGPKYPMQTYILTQTDWNERHGL